jgi:transposase
VAHLNEFIVMVVDGATTHKAKSLIVPNNLELVLLPPYYPELNPEDVVWRRVRRDYIANRYFDSLNEAIEFLQLG